MDSLKLTKSERLILQAIWDTHDKHLPWYKIRTNAKLTVRGFRKVIDKMMKCLLIQIISVKYEHRYCNMQHYTITFRGMRALGVVRADA